MESVKREYTRRQRKIKAMITIELEHPEGARLSLSTRDRSFRLVAETRDISWGGLCLTFPVLPRDREKRFTPPKAHSIVGNSITVNLSWPVLTLYGEVIRFDSRDQVMAVIITKVSDYDLWQELCNQEPGR
ncbi:MAG: hypothetical protein WDA72_07700 [Desulfomonilia bacterium]|jgi:hypothetical protein|nr:hypothetical protein [Deltaproteobacteria bacterium]MDX9761343.1 hypothetical protein [Desulfomonilia bacterium]HPW68548.1 hypothetical protein [Deltaproteobacteria bacterium]